MISSGRLAQLMEESGKRYGWIVAIYAVVEPSEDVFVEGDDGIGDDKLPQLAWRLIIFACDYCLRGLYFCRKGSQTL